MTGRQLLNEVKLVLNQTFPSRVAWSIFKWGLNSMFYFSETACQSKAKESSLPSYLSIAVGRTAGFKHFPRNKWNKDSSKNLTRVADSIFSTWRKVPLLKDAANFIDVAMLRKDKLQSFSFGITFNSLSPWFELVWFPCLMTYQPSWVIQCQSHFIEEH